MSFGKFKRNNSFYVGVDAKWSTPIFFSLFTLAKFRILWKNNKFNFLFFTSCLSGLHNYYTTKCVNKPATSCVLFPCSRLWTSLVQLVDNFSKAWREYQSCYKVVLTTRIHTCYKTQNNWNSVNCQHFILYVSTSIICITEPRRASVERTNRFPLG